MSNRRQIVVEHYRQHGGVIQATHLGIYCKCGNSSLLPYQSRNVDAERKFLQKHCVRLPESYYVAYRKRTARRYTRFLAFAQRAIDASRLEIDNKRLGMAQKALERAAECAEKLTDIRNGVGPVFFALKG